MTAQPNTDENIKTDLRRPEKPVGGQNSDPAKEPVLMQEESVPTDGADTEGEEMMKSVRNDLLENPAPRP